MPLAREDLDSNYGQDQSLIATEEANAMREAKGLGGGGSVHLCQHSR